SAVAVAAGVENERHDGGQAGGERCAEGNAGFFRIAHGFDEERVRACFRQRARLRGEGIGERGGVDIAGGQQLAAGPDGGHHARPPVRRDIATPARLMAARSGSGRLTGLARKVLVRITRLPASQYAAATSSTNSGWLRFHGSGDSPGGSPRCCSSVPQAPSAISGPAESQAARRLIRGPPSTTPRSLPDAFPWFPGSPST